MDIQFPVRTEQVYKVRHSTSPLVLKVGKHYYCTVSYILLYCVHNPDIPTPPSDALCSVLSSTEGITFDLQLDLPYIMRYSVENYRVRVEPQISSCLDGLLSPGDAYSCIGLAIGTNYTFSVSAVNCINQIGATHTINVQPLGKLFKHNFILHVLPPSVLSIVPRAPLGVTVSPIYTSRSQAAQLEELLVQWENMVNKYIDYVAVTGRK